MQKTSRYPVALELERHVNSLRSVKVENVVLKHGRPFIWTERPSGYRRRAIKRCFVNAGKLAFEKRGVYVEGFAMAGKAGLAFHHAWITLDGLHAIEVTLSASNVSYFGIPFSLEVLQRWTVKQGYWGLLHNHYPIEKMEELLTDAGRHRPKFRDALDVTPR
jgi:hypothetical protein